MQPPPENLFLLDPRHQRVLENPGTYYGLRQHLDMLLGIGRLLVWLTLWTVGTGLLLAQVSDKIQLARSGVDHTATVQARDQLYSDGEDRCSVTYTFSYRQPNGEPASQTNTSDLPCTRYADVEPGIELPIWYVPASPTTSTVTPPTVPWREILGALMIILGWFVGLATLVGAATQWYIGVRLTQDGSITYGITEKATSYSDDDGDYQMQVTARFVSPRTGVPLTITNSRVELPRERRPPPPPGTPVAILYRNDNHYALL